MSAEFALTTCEFKTPLRVEFGHASAKRKETQTILVMAHPEGSTFSPAMIGIGECCPRDYVTDETADSVLAFVRQYAPEIEARVGTIENLKNWMSENQSIIDANPAAFAAVEGAVVDFLARRRNQSIEQLLDLPPLLGTFAYTAVLGDSSPWKFWLQALLYRIVGFSDFKIKISGNLTRDRRKIAVFRWLEWFGKIKTRADANNLWNDAQTAIDFVQKLGNPFWAIEEPVAAGNVAQQTEIAHRLDTKIILDESLLRADQISKYENAAELFVANIRISKNGGMLRSLSLAKQAAATGMPLIFGAHVGETTILTRAAMSVANCFGDAVLAREGAFGRLLIKQDAVSPSMRFGKAGRLSPNRFLKAHYTGSGLQIAQQIQQNALALHADTSRPDS